MKLKKGHAYAALWTIGALVFVWQFSGQPITTIAIASCVVTFLILIRVIRSFGLVSSPAVYVTLFAFFHFGTVFGIYVFGFPVPLTGARYLANSGLAIAVILSMFGLMGFVAGTEFYSVRGLRSRPTDSSLPPRFRAVVGRDRDIFNLAIVLLALAAAAYIFVGLQSGVLIAGKPALVAARATGGTQYNLFGVISDLVGVISFIAVAYAPRRYFFWVAAVPVLLDFPIFISGQRGKLIVMVAALAIIAKKKGIRIPTPLAIAAIPAGMFIASLMRQLTKSAGNFGSTWFLNSLYEMGQQINVVMLTMQAIQTHLTDYWFGTSYLWGLWLIIPNVGGLRDLFPQADPGIWITQLYGYSTTIGQFGLGFSSVAEGYLNFGWPGAFLFLGLIGFFLARFERIGAYSPKALAVYGAALGGIFFAIRGDFAAVFRMVVWTLVIIWILKQAAIALRGNSSASRANSAMSNLRITPKRRREHYR